MTDARGQSVSVRLGATAPDGRDTEWAASGRTITFPGYLRAYVEGADDPDAELDDRETLLPPLAVGDALPTPDLEAKGHTTSPPARFTEASLVKRLEELGIGRPSTYASIMQTIQDRGYVWKKGTALVPTWTAFAVVKLLEQHFTDLVDYAFTARMEDDLDEIATRQVEREPWLQRVLVRQRTDATNGVPGLKSLVDSSSDTIDAAELNTMVLGADADGEIVVVKPGRFGPYVKRGEDTASVPEDLPPDELTIDKALELLSAPSGDRPIGIDPESGLDGGRQGRPLRPVRPARRDGRRQAKEKPRTASLFKTHDARRRSRWTRRCSCSACRASSASTLPTASRSPRQNGRYGPYIKKGSDSRSLETEEQLFTRHARRGSRDPRPAQTRPRSRRRRRRCASWAPTRVARSRSC